MGGHFRARSSWIDDIRTTIDDVLVKGVLDVRRPVWCAPQAFHIAFIFRKERLCRAIKREPVLTQAQVRGPRQPRLFQAQLRALSALTPRPGVAEPQRW